MISQFLLRAFVLFSLCASFPWAAQAQRQTNDSAHVRATRLRAKGIPNFGEVSAELYRGGVPNQTGWAELQKKGIDIIVDLRGRNKDEETLATKMGMKYVAIPSHCPFPGDRPYAEFLKIVESNPGRKIFVHCRLGDDRTGMAVAAYRMAEQGWSASEAMKEMQVFGFTRFHRTICPRLASYEAHFPEHLKEDPAFRGLAKSKQGTELHPK